MFDSEITQDLQARKTPRRIFIAGATATAASIGLLAFFKHPDVQASTSVHGTPGTVSVTDFSPDGTSLGSHSVSKILKSDREWLEQLGKNSFGIARQADTEMAFSGVSLNEHHKGIFRCLCCDTALFSSQTKFESGTGWPSFWAPIARQNILEQTDTTLVMERTEVKCVRCEAHLGHVFNDGPQPTGLRYCMNSASMHFVQA